MEPADEQRKAGGGKGCGCQAAIAFLVLIGLPLLFVFSFGMAPCQDGPCDPNGARNFRIVAAIVIAVAVVLGVATWRIVDWHRSRHPGGAGPGRSTAIVLIALTLVAAALLAGIIWA